MQEIEPDHGLTAGKPLFSTEGRRIGKWLGKALLWLVIYGIVINTCRFAEDKLVASAAWFPSGLGVAFLLDLANFLVAMLSASLLLKAVLRGRS